MVNELDLKAKKLLRRKERVKGEVLRIHGEVIREKHGEEGLKKVEERLKEIGCPLNFSKVKSLEWRKEAESALTLLSAKDVLNWTDEDVFFVGWSAPRKSFIIKVLIKYFTSIEKVFKDAKKYWRKHVDFGSMEPVKLDESKRLAIIRIWDHDFDPIICTYWRGYFTSIVELSIPRSEVKIEEEKCIHKGDKYHEFKINWTPKK